LLKLIDRLQLKQLVIHKLCVM